MKTNIKQRGTSCETSSSFSWIRPKIHALDCHRRHRSFIIDFVFTGVLGCTIFFLLLLLLLQSKRKQFHAFCCCSFSRSVVGASSEFDCKLSYFYSVCWEMITFSGIFHEDNFVGGGGGWTFQSWLIEKVVPSSERMIYNQLFGALVTKILPGVSTGFSCWQTLAS